MRTFTSLEMSVAMDHYYEVIGRLDRDPDFWNWLAVDLEEALKAHRAKVTGFNEFQIGDESGAKVDLLLSPHYRTLMKAYQIKYGVKHEA